MIERFTEANTVSREAALAALAGSGIYTSDGDISENYGGKAKKRATRAKR